MPPIYFKLKYNGLTRRVAFQELPHWLDLAAKLYSLYNLPLDKVGVSYIDSDNDEITLSSDEELQDFYQSSPLADVIKLNVLDLSLPRDNPSSLPKRNTASPDNFDIEPGWHPISQFALADILLSKDPLSDGPHAFVEVINSDTSGLEKDHEDFESEDGRSTVQGVSKDKGKQKVSTFGAASVTSLVDEEPGEKLPIHVLDHGMLASANAKDQVDPEEKKLLQSTPTLRAQNVSERQQPQSSAQADDPPLPTFDEHVAPNSSPNLYQDLASFLTMLNDTLSSHPELSEGIRNIVNHATTGEYWRGYSSSISEAAQRLSQNSEAEAVQRISEILGNMFHFFAPSQNGGQQEQNVQPPDPTHRPYPFGHFGPRFDSTNPPYGPRPFRSSRGWHPQWYGGSWPRPPLWFPGAFVPPPPPPPPPPPFAHPPPPVGTPHLNIPPPPPPPRRPMPSPPQYNSQVHVPPPTPSYDTPISPTALPPSTATDAETSRNMAPPLGPLTAEDLRAKVDEAKQLYRAQKDAYRQERARRREKGKAAHGEIAVGMQASTSGSSREPAIEVTWGSHPHQSVPRRANTHIGHGARRHGYNEDSNARARSRVIKKLADMGFTENSHPNLSERIGALFPTGGAISKDREDDIVTVLLEELIPVSPKPPQGSSGRRNEAFPGAWY